MVTLMPSSVYSAFSLCRIWQRQYENCGGWSDQVGNWQLPHGVRVFLHQCMLFGGKRYAPNGQICTLPSIRGIASTRPNNCANCWHPVGYRMPRLFMKQDSRTCDSLRIGGPLCLARGYAAR